MVQRSHMIRYVVCSIVVTLLLHGGAAGADQANGMPIEQISIFGGSSIDRNLILNEFGLKPGDLFQEKSGEEGLKRVKHLSAVFAAELRTLISPGKDSVRLIIIVSETETRSYLPKVSRGLTNKWSIGIHVSETNLRGMDEKVAAEFLIGGETRAMFSYRKPRFDRAPFLEMRYSLLFDEYDYTFPDFKSLLIDEKIQRIRSSLTFRLKSGNLVTFLVSPGIDRIDAADSMLAGQGSGDVPNVPSGTFATLETGVELKNLDRDFYPSSGFRVYAGRKDWGILQEDTEVRNFLYRFKGRLFYGISRVILMFDSRAVFTHGRVPLYLLQHLGGEGSVRGLEFGMLSGQNSVFSSLEARFPINFKDFDEPGNPVFLVDFHIFTDTGACWNKPQEFDTDLLLSGFGCGINIIPSRHFLIKFDYAWQRNTSGIWQIDLETAF